MGQSDIVLSCVFFTEIFTVNTDKLTVNTDKFYKILLNHSFKKTGINGDILCFQMGIFNIIKVLIHTKVVYKYE